MRRPGLALLVTVTACSAPPPPPVPPPAPRLEVPPSSASQPLLSSTVTVRAEARSDTLVRLFVTEDCAGLELLRGPAEDFARGVPVEAVHGRNVFSAVAVDAAGLSSACSEPVAVEARTLMRIGVSAPQVTRVTPTMPTTQRLATLQGTAPVGWTVRVWRGRDCRDGPLVTASADTFRVQGVQVPLSPNRRLEVTLDAQQDAQLTLCNGPVIVLENDELAPEAPRARFFPPAPWPNAEKALLIENLQDAKDVSFSRGDTCTPSTLVPVRTVCGGGVCDAVVLPVAVGAEPIWSLQLIDRAQNRSPCTVLRNDVDPQLEPLPVYVEALDAGISVNLIAITSAPGQIAFHQNAGCFGFGYPPLTYLAPNLAILTEQPRGIWAATVGADAGTCIVAP
jgi:hypothetical protein